MPALVSVRLTELRHWWVETARAGRGAFLCGLSTRDASRPHTTSSGILVGPFGRGSGCFDDTSTTLGGSAGSGLGDRVVMGGILAIDFAAIQGPRVRAADCSDAVGEV